MLSPCTRCFVRPGEGAIGMCLAVDPLYRQKSLPGAGDWQNDGGILPGVCFSDNRRKKGKTLAISSGCCCPGVAASGFRTFSGMPVPVKRMKKNITIRICWQKYLSGVWHLSCEKERKPERLDSVNFKNFQHGGKEETGHLITEGNGCQDTKNDLS